MEGTLTYKNGGNIHRAKLVDLPHCGLLETPIVFHFYKRELTNVCNYNSHRVIQEVVVKMRSEQSVVTLHLVMNRNGHAQGRIKSRLDSFKPHRVLVVLLSNGLFFLPLFALLTVVLDLSQVLEAFEIRQD